MQWVKGRANVPAIRTLQERAQVLRELEVAKAHKLLARGLPIEQVLEQLARGLSQQMLHGPMQLMQGQDAQGAQQLLDGLIPPEQLKKDL